MTSAEPPSDGAAPRPLGARSAMRILAALLDRSLEQISDAAADARRFDRELIRAASDVWDNNLFPLFWAASTADAEEREQRALAALEWMAALSERRRGWMIEQAAIAGHDLEPLLSPVKPSVPERDYRGHVMAPVHQVTRRSVQDLAVDYDLTTADVRHLEVERAGSSLTAFLQLVVPRRYAPEEGSAEAPALLDLYLDRVTDVVFGLADTCGAILDPQADGISISLGDGGRLHAEDGEYRCDDRSWHLSAADRRADSVTPPRTDRPGCLSRPPTGELGADAYAAASLLRHVMWEIRSVRYPEHADTVPIHRLCQIFGGAGQAILAAGSLHGCQRREAAFRELIRTWADRGGPGPARWLAGILTAAGRSDLIEVPQAPERPPPALDAPVHPAHTPPEAALVMAAWTAAHDDHGAQRPATAQLLLALPPRPGARPPAAWRLRAVSCAPPDDFRLHTRAFCGTGPLTGVGQPTSAGGIDLHHGALSVVPGTAGARP